LIIAAAVRQPAAASRLSRRRFHAAASASAFASQAAAFAAADMPPDFQMIRFLHFFFALSPLSPALSSFFRLPAWRGQLPEAFAALGRFSWLPAMPSLLFALADAGAFRQPASYAAAINDFHYSHSFHLLHF